MYGSFDAFYAFTPAFLYWQVTDHTIDDVTIA